MVQEVPKFVAPQLGRESFTCPHCHTMAQMMQGPVNLIYDRSNVVQSKVERAAAVSCRLCYRPIIFIDSKLVYPLSSSAPLPNPDLSEDVRTDYSEAADVLPYSPRAAAALLRLCVQKLCKELGESGENINADIKSLVKKGLRPSVQRALDAVRVVGNNAVHPGEMDIRDDVATATALFGLVNHIAQNMISEPKEIDAIYEAIPEGLRDAIDRRDA